MKFQINRFPKMAALQKFRALKLGYPKEQAEAIGVAEATKYAIFKNLYLYRRQGKEEQAHSLAPEYYQEKEKLDWKTFAPFKLAAKEGKPYVGGKTFSWHDYHQKVLKRWGSQGAKKLENWAQSIVENTPKEILENEQKFFKKVWLPHRDDPLEVEI